MSKSKGCTAAAGPCNGCCCYWGVSPCALPPLPHQNQQSQSKYPSNTPKPTLEEIELAQALERKEFAHTAMMNVFTEKTVAKALRSEIGQLVYKAKVAQDIDLNEKRKRLMRLLSTESVQYAKEQEIKDQQRMDRTIQERQDTAMALRAERFRKDREFAQQMELQKILCNSDGFRSTLAHKHLLESKHAQLVQMRDKALLADTERQRDRLWLDVRQRWCDEYDERERAKAELRTEKGRCTHAMLREQMAERAARAWSQRRAIPAATSLLLPAEKRLLDAGERRRNQLSAYATQLRAQIAERRVTREQMEAEVRDLEAIILRACVDEMEREERERLATVQRRKRETRTYLDYLRQFHDEERCERARLDALCDELNRQIVERQMAGRCDAVHRSRAETREVKAFVVGQIRERECEAHREHEARLAEAILLNQLSAGHLATDFAGNDAVTILQRMLRRLEFAQALRQQIAQKAELQRMQASIECEFDRKEEEERRRVERMVREHATDETGGGGAGVHPNLRLLCQGEAKGALNKAAHCVRASDPEETFKKPHCFEEAVHLKETPPKAHCFE